MANLYTASCKCGFEGSVRTGGARKTFQTECYFPFYCKQCGLINVNEMEPHDHCPRCKSGEIKPYGDATTSLDSRFKMVTSYHYSAPTEGNFCPKCGAFTLNFELQMIIG